MLRASRLLSLSAFDHDRRNLARRLLLIVSEAGHLGRLLVEEALALRPVGNGCAGGELLLADLDRDVGIGAQVEEPGRALRRAPERGDDDEVVAVLGVDQRRRARSARLRAGGCQEQQRRTRKVPGDFAAVRAELLDDLAVELCMSAGGSEVTGRSFGEFMCAGEDLSELGDLGFSERPTVLSGGPPIPAVLRSDLE